MKRSELPLDIWSGVYLTGHCQGIAVDTEKGFVYYSFTTCLVKTDMQGQLVGTVTGLIGHMGCISFCEEDGLVYGSLEYKNDSIGKGILKGLGLQGEVKDAFYCAVFDADRITRPGMDARADGVMRAAYLSDVVRDYLYEENGVKHRYGCSGIDGTAIGPLPGSGPEAEKRVLIAYGIYCDTGRDDNDDQVILAYDRSDIVKSALPLDQEHMHTSGPSEPLCRMFARTGNTDWGIQNLEYDRTTGDYIAAVYPGKKPIYANKPMYFFSGAEMGPGGRLRVSGVSDFPYGSTGVASLPEGLYYFSEDGGNRENGWYTHAHLYVREGKGFLRL